MALFFKSFHNDDQGVNSYIFWGGEFILILFRAWNWIFINFIANYFATYSKATVLAATTTWAVAYVGMAFSFHVRGTCASGAADRGSTVLAFVTTASMWVLLLLEQKKYNWLFSWKILTQPFSSSYVFRHTVQSWTSSFMIHHYGSFHDSKIDSAPIPPSNNELNS